MLGDSVPIPVELLIGIGGEIISIPVAPMPTPLEPSMPVDGARFTVRDSAEDFRHGEVGEHIEMDCIQSLEFNPDGVDCLLIIQSDWIITSASITMEGWSKDIPSETYFTGVDLLEELRSLSIGPHPFSLKVELEDGSRLTSTGMLTITSDSGPEDPGKGEEKATKGDDRTLGMAGVLGLVVLLIAGSALWRMSRSRPS
jgi:hypothetical protein